MTYAVLLIIDYWLFIIYYLLFIIDYWLLIIDYLLFIIYYLLFITYTTFFISQNTATSRKGVGILLPLPDLFPPLSSPPLLTQERHGSHIDLDSCRRWVLIVQQMEERKRYKWIQGIISSSQHSSPYHLLTFLHHNNTPHLRWFCLICCYRISHQDRCVFHG